MIDAKQKEEIERFKGPKRYERTVYNARIKILEAQRDAISLKLKSRSVTPPPPAFQPMNTTPASNTTPTTATTTATTETGRNNSNYATITT